MRIKCFPPYYPATLPCRVQFVLDCAQRGWEAPSRAGTGLMVCVTKPLSTHGTQKHRAGLGQWGQQKHLQVSAVLLSRILEMERAARARTRAERSFVVMLSSTKRYMALPTFPMVKHCVPTISLEKRNLTEQILQEHNS